MLLIFGFLLMVFIFIFVGTVAGASVGTFIDLPSASMILVPLLIFLILTKSGGVIGRYIKTSFRKEHSYSRSELACLSSAIKSSIKFILATGWIGFFSGLIACLLNLLRLENRDMLGPNLAVSLIIVLYSFSISYFVFFPTQAWAENKINALENDK
jgi:flagellar motor component MotA